MRVACCVLLGILGIAVAQGPELPSGALGTRANGSLTSTASRPPVEGGNLIQMVIALGIVAVGLRYGLPKLLAWSAKSGLGSRLDGEIRLIESRAVPGGSLHLVQVRGRTFLIGSTPQTIHLLAEFQPEETASDFSLRPTSSFQAALSQADQRVLVGTSEAHKQLRDRLREATDQLRQMAERTR